MAETLELVTRAEFARLQGVSRKTVTKYVQTGRVSLVVRNGREFIDPVAARIALKGTVQRAQETRDILEGAVAVEPSPVTPSLTQFKTETERERSALLRLQREERQGKLVDRDQVELEQETAARMVRRALDAVPSHAEDIFAAGKQSGVAGVRKALKGMMREAQEQLAQSIRNAADEVEAQRRADNDEAA